MILLHVSDINGDSTLRDIDVWSPDADVLILLMDLVAHGRLGAFTKLNSSLEKTTSIDQSRLVSV